MIKIRNKRIALLLVLAMLATMFVGVGTASAETDYFNVTSTWSWVKADEVTEDVASIKVVPDDVGDIASDIDSIFVEISLPEGVEFDVEPTTSLGTIDSFSADMVVVDTGATTFSEVVIDEIDLDVDDDVTGSIYATVRVFAKQVDTNSFAIDEDYKKLIAKVSSGDVTVSAASAKTMYVGSDQKGAKITIKEVGPNAFADYIGETEDIKLVILTSGVTWYDGELSNAYCDSYYDEENNKVAFIEVTDDDAAQTSKIIFTPYFRVSPAAEGEVKVRVSGENIETTTFVVGKVGASSIAVEVKDADEDFVYRGQFATFDDVEINLDPKNEELNDTDWFSITLPDGLKFADVDDPAEISNSDIVFEELIKKDKTAWFTIKEDAVVTDDFDITDFVIVADADAALGDLSVTFAGAVEGTYVIGSVKDAFTVTTTPFALQTGLTNVAGADIVITETGDEALAATGFGYEEADGSDKYYGYFSVVLPAGVTWAGVPTIEVTEGDLEIGDVEFGEDHRILFFPIYEQSNIQSTITISDIKYSVLSQPGLGDIKVTFGGASGYGWFEWDGGYNIYSSKPLAEVAIGTVATNPTAVYVIGAPTFTVNGAVNNVVTPSYIKDARTYLAIRDIATGLGIDPMNVMWDAVGQKVTLIKGTKIVQVTIGSNVMLVNGVAVAMDVAPEISNGRTMLPAAFIAQAFGATASWDALTQTVTIK